MAGAMPGAMPGAMVAGWQIGIGSALTLAGWLVPRRVAGAQRGAAAALLLDLLPVALVAAWLLIATGRPVFTGSVVLALGAGFALADDAKRETLREPVIFSDMSELPHVFTHPQLYLPFAGTGLVIGGAVAAVAAGGALLAFEPRLFAFQPALVLAGAVAATALWSLGHEPLLGAAAARLRRFEPNGDPLDDAARLGPFAVLLVYGIIARAERTARRTRHPPLPAPFLAHPAAAAVPLVLVQCESFFDARRLSPRAPRDLLPGFERCRSTASSYGRLDVSGWGANTMRAEFAVLTGIPETDLGYDRFNPYHALARAPLASLARDLRGHGYKTMCLHPFDRGFFRRDEVIPKLGFDVFLGRETLGGSRRPPYLADPDLARLVLEAVAREGPRVFVFAITMGNHGPWHGSGKATDGAAWSDWFEPRALPQGGELASYLDGLRRSDEMLEILMDGFERLGDGILGFYGDHLPSLPRAFAEFGFDDWSSDYVLWPGATAPRRVDLPADRLPQLVKEALRNREAIGPRADTTVFIDGAA